MKNADMPAMPVFNSNGAPVHWSNGGLDNDGVMCGLTKREIMAIAAMQGLLAHGGCESFVYVAGDAVRVADALLAELEMTKDK